MADEGGGLDWAVLGVCLADVHVTLAPQHLNQPVLLYGEQGRADGAAEMARGERGVPRTGRLRCGVLG